MLTGLIISIALAATFLCLYVCAVQDKASLNRDNQWLRKQREDSKQSQTQPKTIGTPDDRILDKDTVIEAIKANGYEPLVDGDAVYIKRGDAKYQIGVDRFPIVPIASVYTVDEKEFDIETFRRAAQDKTSNCVIGKVVFLDYDDVSYGVAFTLGTVEKKYGHFRDSLETYLYIIEDLHDRFHHTYESMIRNAQTVEQGSLPEYARKWEA